MFLLGKLVMGIFLTLAALPLIRQSKHPTCSELLQFLQGLSMGSTTARSLDPSEMMLRGGVDQVMEDCARKGFMPFLDEAS